MSRADGLTWHARRRGSALHCAALRCTALRDDVSLCEDDNQVMSFYVQTPLRRFVADLSWTRCRRCSKLVLPYICCVFHRIDNRCSSVGMLHNKSTTN